MVSTESESSIGRDFDAPAQLATKARNENFPVASRLLPRAVRANLMAIYGFARLTDDVGDEAEGDRLALLDWLEAELDRAASGRAIHPVLVQLTPVIRELDLSLDPFRRLIEANRMDQRITRYRSFGDLVDYCMFSAAPVGRLVLAVFGVSTSERIASSDKVCIALQLVEHLQDVGEDAATGPDLPADRRHGALRVHRSRTARVGLVPGTTAARRHGGAAGKGPARGGSAARRVAPASSPGGGRGLRRRRDVCTRLDRTVGLRRARESLPSSQAPVRQAGPCHVGGGEQEARRVVNTELAYDFCEAVTREEAKNFAYGIRLLRKPERRALSAVYALARRIDDIGDGQTASPAEKLASLQAVRKIIDPVDPGSNDPVLVAVAHAARRYGLSMSCFGEIIDGCEMDVTGTTYETIDDLVGYCRKVAGAVGRLSLPMFGTRDLDRAVPLADSLGVALQLTNILRDVVEDRCVRARVPAEQGRRVGRLRSRAHGPRDRRRAPCRARVRTRRPVVRRGAAAPAVAGQPGPSLRRRHGRHLQAFARPDRGGADRSHPRAHLIAGLGEGIGRRAEPRRGTTVSGARVGVVGGGLAGMAAALAAADGGAEVVLFERRSVLGGLTASIRHNGLSFDNGQHVFLRCCTAYRGFIDRIGAAAAGVPAEPARRAGALAGRRRAPRSGGPAFPPRCTSQGRSRATATCRFVSGRALCAAGARAPQARPRRRLARRRLVRRLARCPRAEQTRGRPPLEPDRIADAQRPCRRRVAGARHEGLPRRASRPVRRRRHRLVTGAARRASRSHRRTGLASSRRRDGSRQRCRRHRPRAARRFRPELRGAKRRGRRGDPGHAAACNSEPRGGARVGHRRAGGRAPRCFSHRQCPLRPRSEGDGPSAHGLRGLAGPVRLRPHRLERGPFGPMPLHLALGCGRPHRHWLSRARKPVLRGAARAAPGRAPGPAPRRGRDPREGGDVPGHSRLASRSAQRPRPRFQVCSSPAPGATQGGRRPWKVRSAAAKRLPQRRWPSCPATAPGIHDNWKGPARDGDLLPDATRTARSSQQSR